jgi:hypothetical protein
MIADETTQNDERKHREDLRLYRESGTVGYRGHRLNRIVGTLHFAPSSASRLVQAATWWRSCPEFQTTPQWQGAKSSVVDVDTVLDPQS